MEIFLVGGPNMNYMNYMMVIRCLLCFTMTSARGENQPICKESVNSLCFQPSALYNINRNDK